MLFVIVVAVNIFFVLLKKKEIKKEIKSWDTQLKRTCYLKSEQFQ